MPLRFRSRLHLAPGQTHGAPSGAARLPSMFGSLLARSPRALLVPVLAACWWVTLPVQADATVVVELKRPDGTTAEGNVQLTKGDSKYRCSTDKAGRCELRGVAGGVYTVNVEQVGRPAAKEKTVVIPPNGEVKLIVNAS